MLNEAKSKLKDGQRNVTVESILNQLAVESNQLCSPNVMSSSVLWRYKAPLTVQSLVTVNGDIMKVSGFLSFLCHCCIYNIHVALGKKESYHQMIFDLSKSYLISLLIFTGEMSKVEKNAGAWEKTVCYKLSAKHLEADEYVEREVT